MVLKGQREIKEILARRVHKASKVMLVLLALQGHRDRKEQPLTFLAHKDRRDQLDRKVRRVQRAMPRRCLVRKDRRELSARKVRRATQVMSARKGQSETLGLKDRKAMQVRRDQQEPMVKTVLSDHKDQRETLVRRDRKVRRASKVTLAMSGLKDRKVMSDLKAHKGMLDRKARKGMLGHRDQPVLRLTSLPR